MLFGSGAGLTSSGCVFYMSRIKVTRDIFCEKGFLLIFLRNIYHRAFICSALIDLTKNKTLIDFGFTWLNVMVTIVTFVKII